MHASLAFVIQKRETWGYDLVFLSSESSDLAPALLCLYKSVNTVIIFNTAVNRTRTASIVYT